MLSAPPVGAVRGEHHLLRLKENRKFSSKMKAI